MKKGIYGKKLGMTQIFDNDGLVIPVTVVEVEPSLVLRKKTVETDGYDAVQVGFLAKKEKLAKKKTETFTGAYWCLVTAIYLGWSLWTKQWNITYIVWPVAAVLYAAMYGIVKVVMKVD